jgi:hypothetical protein
LSPDAERSAHNDAAERHKTAAAWFRKAARTSGLAEEARRRAKLHDTLAKKHAARAIELGKRGGKFITSKTGTKHYLKG